MATTRLEFQPENSPRQLFSVIVPLYNNNETITPCIESLLAQSYAPIEVIVVDDGSTDSSDKQAKALAEKSKDIRYVATSHLGASHARNVGLARSNGEVVLFADADAIYEKEYLKKCIDLLSTGAATGAVCVTGSIWIRKDTIVTRCLSLEYKMKQKFIEEGRLGPYFAFVYTREALRNAGGYDENLFQGEDKDLFYRVKEAGFTVGIVPGFNWFHRYPQDFASLVRRSYRGGKSRILFIAKRRRYGEFIRSVGLLWLLVPMGITFSVVPGSRVLILAALPLLYLYRVGLSLRYSKESDNLSNNLLLPIVSATRYFATAVGYSIGFLIFVSRRARGRPTSWSNL